MALDDVLRSTIVKGFNIDSLLKKYLILNTKPEALLGASAQDEERLNEAKKEVLGDIKQRIEQYDSSTEGRRTIYTAIFNGERSPQAQRLREEALEFLSETEKDTIASAVEQGALEQYALEALEYKVEKLDLPEVDEKQKEIYNYKKLGDDLKAIVDDYFVNDNSLAEVLMKFAKINKPGGVKKELGPEATEEDSKKYKEGLEKDLKKFIEAYLPNLSEKVVKFVVDRIKDGGSFLPIYLASIENEIMAGAYATMPETKKKEIGYKIGENNLKEMGYIGEQEDLLTQTFPELAQEGGAEDYTQSTGNAQAGATA